MLPNAMHGDWASKAIKAKKHVLCDKPFAANEQDATEVWRKAKQARSLVIMAEAFYYRHHPLFDHLIDSVSR